MHVLAVQPETLFKALSDSTRLRIIRLLVMTGEEICLCELVDTLFEAQYNLSRHLKVLRQAGLLTAQKDGRWVYHRLTTDPAYLQQLYNLVYSLPDPDATYSADLQHFKNRMALRDDGRCHIGVLSDNLKVRAK